MVEVVRRFGPMDVDLAASAKNTKAPIFITEKQDSLKSDWGIYGGTCGLIRLLGTSRHGPENALLMATELG